MPSAPPPPIDIEAVLHLPPSLPTGKSLGRSRQGREIFGYHFGHGPRHVSLIAGCHADEPVGPATLDRLVAHLAALPADHPALADYSWYLVPHVNPDGEARNAAWSNAGDGLDGVYDLATYLRQVVREAPGDDVEFGFPHTPDDQDARPENLALARFLAPAAPFVLHASLHGMAFAAGPWFLLEHSWAARSAAMRHRLRQQVKELGYVTHDIDRGGEKGFHRIDVGFTSRPDSVAMRAHFENLGDSRTAALFRPSSMEYVRSLGGDPLTLVSEMPLFILPARHFAGRDPIRPAAVQQLLQCAAANDLDGLHRHATAAGLRAMPLLDQSRLQLAFLAEGLAAVASAHFECA